MHQNKRLNVRKQHPDGTTTTNDNKRKTET